MNIARLPPIGDRGVFKVCNENYGFNYFRMHGDRISGIRKIPGQPLVSVDGQNYPIDWVNNIIRIVGIDPLVDTTRRVDVDQRWLKA